MPGPWSDSGLVSAPDPHARERCVYKGVYGEGLGSGTGHVDCEWDPGTRQACTCTPLHPHVSPWWEGSGQRVL